MGAAGGWQKGTQISRSPRSEHSNVQLFRLLGIAGVIYTQTKTDMPLREDVGKNSPEHLAPVSRR